MKTRTKHYQLNPELRAEYQATRAPSYLSSRILAEIREQNINPVPSTRWSHPLALATACSFIILLIIFQTPDKEQLPPPRAASIAIDIPSLSRLPKPEVKLEIPSLSALAGIPTTPSKPGLINPDKVSG